MSSRRFNVLLCDAERETADVLAVQFYELGHSVTVARSCTEAFGAACAHDYDALLCAPFVHDGTALALPRALGIRRPKLVVLVSRMSERHVHAAARRVGFDAQMTKVVDPRRLERLVQSSVAMLKPDRLSAWTTRH